MNVNQTIQPLIKTRPELSQTKNHFRGREIKSRLELLYDKGITRGLYCGFEKLNEHYSVKRGVTTYIYGAPFSGKTEFWFDVLVNMTELHGWKHAIFSPETGSCEEIAAEIISKKCRKPFYKQQDGFLSEQEFYKELDWFDEYFFIIDPKDGDITVDQFYASVDALEKEYGVKVDSTLIDPFNELKHEFGADGRQDLYIENKLGLVRRNAQNFNRHNAIITHCTDQVQIKDTDINGNDIYYYTIPSPRQIAGGQAWYRKAMNLICVYRPPINVIDKSTGTPYLENEANVIIQKYKPKGTGKKGLVKLYFDPQTNRYYELIGNQKRYSGKQGTGTYKPIVQADIF